VTIRYIPEALEEIQEAITYYESERPSLGSEFAVELARTVDRIRARPDAWQPLGRSARRCRMQRFPFGVVYFVREDQIVIVAVMHLHRRPGYWRDRLRGDRT
jgi:plasmid stabilization system protein ParE